MVNPCPPRLARRSGAATTAEAVSDIDKFLAATRAFPDGLAVKKQALYQQGKAGSLGAADTRSRTRPSPSWRDFEPDYEDSARGSWSRPGRGAIDLHYKEGVEALPGGKGPRPSSSGGLSSISTPSTPTPSGHRAGRAPAEGPRGPQEEVASRPARAAPSARRSAHHEQSEAILYAAEALEGVGLNPAQEPI